MAVDGALGYEQPRADLLIAQAVGHQPGNLAFALPQDSGTAMV